MKVLVISLLRLGDFIQALPAISGLKTELNVDRLDLLTHGAARSMQPMIRDIDQWWTIDREELQEGLARADVPLLTPFSILKEELDRISSVGYDCLINLTHTRFSGWISGYIPARRRIGLAFQPRGQAYFHSPWFEYLDEHAEAGPRDMFHYTDIFFHSCGLKSMDRAWGLLETKRGQDEAREFVQPSAEKIVVQLFTSDEKKNWEESAWLTALNQLKLFRPKADFIFLCSPAEAEKAEKVRAAADARSLPARVAVLSLEGAYSLLKKSNLLITGDTSIKHLANAAGVKILELSLGSSDWRRTGAYSADSLILQPRTACAPCSHSSPCGQSAHLCGQELPAELVAASAHHLLASDWAGLAKLFAEFSGEVSGLRTRVSENGYWYATEWGAENPAPTVHSLIERSTLRFMLNHEDRAPLPQFGSEGVRLAREISRLFGEGRVRIAKDLEILENETARQAESAQGSLHALGRRPLADSERPIDIGGLRRLQGRMERELKKARIKLKLIRELKSQMTESP